MIRRTSRDTMIGLALACAAAIAGTATTAVAQLPKHEKMTVTTDDVYVRSGSTDAHYPFGRLKAGNVVVVIGEDDSWAQVLTVGSAFETFYGYIEVIRDAGNVSLATAPDGTTTLTTTSKVSLLGSNLNSRRPADSWMSIWKPVPVGTKFVVLDTLEATGSIYYKVKIKGKLAHGWISTAHLRRATPAEAAALDRELAGMAVAAGPRQKPQGSQGVLGSDERRTPNVTGLDTPRRPANNTTDTAVSDDAWVGPPIPEGYAAETPKRETPAVISADPPPGVDPFEAASEDPTPDPTPAQDDPETERTDPEVAEPVTPTPVTPRQPVTSYRADLTDLESAFEALKKEPIETAEVQPLRTLYLDLAKRATDSRRVRRYAEARAEQLQIWSELQVRRQELTAVKDKISSAADDVQAARHALDRGGDYVAVGRLLASTIFDGKRLPMLYRLQDAGTGRTVAYVKRSEEFDLVALLDQFIGIVGEKKYDPTLQLHVIEPIRHIDILAPRKDRDAAAEEASATDAE